MESKYYQSWFVDAPIKNDGTCDEFWEMKCEHCGQYNGIHKLSCKTGKLTVHL
jgi:translation initiation factor 2 beta subunit (eIF-2beta)/eIF-5